MKPNILNINPAKPRLIRHVCRDCSATVSLPYIVWRFHSVHATRDRCQECGSLFIEPADLKHSPKRKRRNKCLGVGRGKNTTRGGRLVSIEPARFAILRRTRDD